MHVKMQRAIRSYSTTTKGQIPKIIVNMRTKLLVVKCAENFTIQKSSVCQTRLYLICPDAGVILSVLKENESKQLMMILAVMNLRLKLIKVGKSQNVFSIWPILKILYQINNSNNFIC